MGIYQDIISEVVNIILPLYKKQLGPDGKIPSDKPPSEGGLLCLVRRIQRGYGTEDAKRNDSRMDGPRLGQLRHVRTSRETIRRVLLP